MILVLSQVRFWQWIRWNWIIAAIFISRNLFFHRAQLKIDANCRVEGRSLRTPTNGAELKIQDIHNAVKTAPWRSPGGGGGAVTQIEDDGRYSEWGTRRRPGRREMSGYECYDEWSATPPLAHRPPPSRPPSPVSPIDSSVLFVGEILSRLFTTAVLFTGLKLKRKYCRASGSTVCLYVVLTVWGAWVFLRILFLDLSVHSNTVFAPSILSSGFLIFYSIKSWTKCYKTPWILIYF